MANKISPDLQLAADAADDNDLLDVVIELATPVIAPAADQPNRAERVALGRSVSLGVAASVEATVARLGGTFAETVWVTPTMTVQLPKGSLRELAESALVMSLATPVRVPFSGPLVQVSETPSDEVLSQFRGEWVAMKDDEIIGHHSELRAVVEQLHAAEIRHDRLFFVPVEAPTADPIHWAIG